MPMLPQRPCSYPGCPKLVPGGVRGGKCDKHRGAIQREYDRARPAHLKNFYTCSRWRQLRAVVRSEEPFCRRCQQEGRLVPGQQVDHIKSIREAWDLRFERSNLQNLCLSCHRSKTRQEEATGGGRDLGP